MELTTYSGTIRPAGSTSQRPWLLYLLVATFCGVVLGLVPGFFLGHDVTPKSAVLLIGTALAILLWKNWAPGILALLASRLGQMFCALLLVQLLSVWVSSALSTQPPLSLAGTTWRRFGAVNQTALLIFAAIVAGYGVSCPNQRGKLKAAILWSGVTAAAYAISQFVGWDPLLDSKLYTFEYLGPVVRPPATLGHAIYLAAFLVPIVILAFSSALDSGRRSPMRLLYLAAAAACVSAIVMSGTRSAVLGLLFGSAVFLIRTAPQHRRRAILVAATALLCALVAVALVVWISPQRSLENRLAQWIQDAKGGPRLIVWRDSLALVSSHPIVGVGPEAFAAEFRKVQSSALANAYPDHYHESPHNILLDAAIAQGIPGMCSVLGLLVVGLSGLRHESRREANPTDALTAGLTGLIVALQFACFTLPTAVLFYTLVALLVAAACSAPAKPIEAFKGGLWRIPQFTAVALLILAAGLYVRHDAAFAQLRRQLESRDLDGALNSYQAVSEMRFPKPGNDLWWSRELAAHARGLDSQSAGRVWQAARQASARAEVIGEEPFNAMYQSAVLAFAMGDAAGGERSLRSVFALSPTWYKPHLLLARVLWLTRRAEEASREGDIALALSRAIQDEVRKALLQAQSEAPPR